MARTIVPSVDVSLRDRCCLCGKPHASVEKLILGLHGGVCAECVDLAYATLHAAPEDREEALEAAQKRADDAKSWTLLKRLFGKP